jgi:uncharacterized alkaline shock family protein YloU
VERAHFVAVTTELGTVSVSAGALVEIVGRAALESYGVVALASARWWEKLVPSGSTKGIQVVGRDGDVAVDVHVVIEQGLNLTEVGAAVRARVAHEIERHTGLRVAGVEVHVDRVRQSR